LPFRVHLPRASARAALSRCMATRACRAVGPVGLSGLSRRWANVASADWHEPKTTDMCTCALPGAVCYHPIDNGVIVSRSGSTLFVVSKYGISGRAWGLESTPGSISLHHSPLQPLY